MGMTEVRKTLTILLGAATVLMAYVALTIPMVAMVGPLLLAVLLGVGAYFAWPRDGRSERQPARER